MTAVQDLRTICSQRLGDIANAVFTTGELDAYVTAAVQSLYPTYFQYAAATTVASAGPLQTMPAGARNIYYIGEQKPTSTRVRMIRQWKEGVGTTFVPKVNIAGETLVWAWTTGFTVGATVSTPFVLSDECVEPVILRTCISALERVASSRVETAKYFALTVREGVTEQDIISILDAYHASLDARIKQAVARPARVG